MPQALPDIPNIPNIPNVLFQAYRERLEQSPVLTKAITRYIYTAQIIHVHN